MICRLSFGFDWEALDDTRYILLKRNYQDGITTSWLSSSDKADWFFWFVDYFFAFAFALFCFCKKGIASHWFRIQRPFGEPFAGFLLLLPSTMTRTWWWFGNIQYGFSIWLFSWLWTWLWLLYNDSWIPLWLWLRLNVLLLSIPLPSQKLPNHSKREWGYHHLPCHSYLYPTRPPKNCPKSPIIMAPENIRSR